MINYYHHKFPRTHLLVLVSHDYSGCLQSTQVHLEVVETLMVGHFALSFWALYHLLF